MSSDDLILSSLLTHTVSFKIYDFDGDGFISVTDLTAVVAATLREHQIVILRTEIDEIVAHTMQEAHTKNPNMISIEEYIALSSNHPHMLAQLTINISKYVLYCLRFNGCYSLFRIFIFIFTQHHLRIHPKQRHSPEYSSWICLRYESPYEVNRLKFIFRKIHKLTHINMNCKAAFLPHFFLGCD